MGDGENIERAVAGSHRAEALRSLEKHKAKQRRSGPGGKRCISQAAHDTLCRRLTALKRKTPLTGDEAREARLLEIEMGIPISS